MKKNKIIAMTFALIVACSGMQAQTSAKIDSTLFTAFYHYTIRTQDDAGLDVTDSIQLALMVGTRATHCTNIQSYNRDGSVSIGMLNAFRMHIQIVQTDMEKAEVTTVESIYPYRYQTNAPLAKVDWVITDDTLTICGLPCQRATGTLYGKHWTVWYTERIPSSAGPWKLRGLPGLIVKAEDAEGIHHFSLYETKNEIRDIISIANHELHKLSRKKLMTFKKKTLGNPRYVKDPTYYVAEYADDIAETYMDGVTHRIGLNSHMLILDKGHVYQPLELE